MAQLKDTTVNGTLTIGSSPVADFVIEQGTKATSSGGLTWKYRKWNSGTIECWGAISVNKEMNSSNTTATAWNSVTFDKTLTGFPVTLKSTPRVYLSNAPGSKAQFFILGCGANTTHITNIEYARYNTTTTTAFAANIDVYVVGEWK